MGLFIAVEVLKDKCVGIDECGKCIEVCPVQIFAGEHGIPSIISKNEDECILCDQCIQGCKPNAISIGKKY
ncbi:MAG: 4Fe-4S dicluster domain-containing protein [Deltaproteobacteria bacterium]|nr:4Fe-4S dicluster domain-containing protein [Deltaproteobacteria bacterium]